ncbi:MAG: hypothetical protein ACK6DA_14035, partial [Candidatus Kapaibacterium sp.]
YLSARVPSLPWIFDTIPNPKFNEDVDVKATDFFVKNVNRVSVDEYEVTLGLNGFTNSATSLEFSVNGDIVGLQSPTTVNKNDEVDYIADNSNSKVIVATSHHFNAKDDVLTFRVKTLENTLELNGVSFDVRKRAAKTVALNAAETGLNVSVSPMPLHNTDANISVGVEQAGVYEIALLSITGEKVYSKSVSAAANTTLNEVIPVTELNLTAGAYQVVISNGSFVKTAKVSILR